MRSYRRIVRCNLYSVLFLILAACTQISQRTPAETAVSSQPVPAIPTATETITLAPGEQSFPTQEAPAPLNPGVVFVKNGDIHFWNEATQQTAILFSAGDASRVILSSDNQIIAFVRRSLRFQSAESWSEQSALWAIDLHGENLRELVSSEELRQRLNAGENDSTEIAQLEWIPGTHELVFSGTKFFAQGEGESHALPEGVYVVNTETGKASDLAPAGNHLYFVPSPDGRQIALMSPTSLSFSNVDGSHMRHDVLTYPETGVPVPLIPHGVWTQNSDAFLIVAPIESGSPFELNFTIWKIELDSLTAESLATVTDDSHPDSVTFSPDGLKAAYYRWPEPAWLITPLVNSGGPLTITYSVETGWANLHWAPDGAAYAFSDSFTGNLFQLCPDASQNSDVCGDPVNLGNRVVAGIQWIDDDRFLLLTREPPALYLGTFEGEIIPIVSWLPEETSGLRSFSATYHPAAAITTNLGPAGEVPDKTATPVCTAGNAWSSNLQLPDQPGLLRVLFTVNSQYWLWRKETETAAALPIFRENWPAISPDGRHIAFTQTPGEQERELWVVDSDGRNERQIATLSTAETVARYPEEENENLEVGLAYWWDTDHTLVYRLSPQLFIAGVAREAVYRVDVDTGTSQLVLPPGEYGPDFKLSPDNRFVAALTADSAELHLINLADNQVLLKLPAISPILTFSPDGRFLLLPAQQGATVVDTVDLTQRSISFPYRGISVPGGPAGPPSHWRDAAAGYFVISENSDGPEFTLWQVDLGAGTSAPVGSYAGFALLATFSLDGRTLAFWEEAGDGFRNLHLVDVATGTDTVYDTGRYSLLFDHWLADSDHFVYSYWDSSTFTQRFLQVGQIGEPPNSQAITLSGSDPQWVDDLRFLQLQEIPTDGTGQRAALCLQALNTAPVLVGELSALPDGFMHYLYFFESP